MIQNITNRRKVEDNGPDFYPTPAWGTLALLKYETFEGNILEPCCGEGDMSRVLEAQGYDVTSSDLYDRGYGKQQDFFEVMDTYDNVVTNPPFNIAEDILEHALKITNNKVCLLVRTAFLESRGRYNKFYKSNPPARVWVFSERLSMYPKGYEVKGGGTTSYSWMVWDKTSIVPPLFGTKLNWIEPGLKPTKKSKA